MAIITAPNAEATSACSSFSYAQQQTNSFYVDSPANHTTGGWYGGIESDIALIGGTQGAVYAGTDSFYSHELSLIEIKTKDGGTPGTGHYCGQGGDCWIQDGVDTGTLGPYHPSLSDVAAPFYESSNIYGYADTVYFGTVSPATSYFTVYFDGTTYTAPSFVTRNEDSLVGEMAAFVCLATCSQLNPGGNLNAWRDWNYATAGTEFATDPNNGSETVYPAVNSVFGEDNFGNQSLYTTVNLSLNGASWFQGTNSFPNFFVNSPYTRPGLNSPDNHLAFQSVGGGSC